MPMALPNKIGVIGGTGAVFNIAYRIVNRNQLLSNNIGNVPSISVGTGPIEIKLEGIKYANNVNNTEFKSLLDKYFGISKSLSNLDYNEKFNVNTNTLEIISNEEQTSKVIDELDKINPNWRDNFINSPLESENPVTQFILNSLMDSLMLDFISIYLLWNLLVILIIKLILSNNINFDKLNKYPLGIYINKYLVKFISMWQKSSNFWIFFIVIILIISNTASGYGLYRLFKFLS